MNAETIIDADGDIWPISGYWCTACGMPVDRIRCVDQNISEMRRGIVDVDYALSLIAEATAHGVTILYSTRKLGMSTMCHSWRSPPVELLDQLYQHANGIWAILHPSPKAGAR